MSKELEALECVERLDNMDFYRSIETYVSEIDSDISETQYLGNTDEFYIIKQALIKTQELKSENKVLLEENKDLYVELAFAEKQYKELMDCIAQCRKAFDIIKEKEVNIPFLKSAATFDKYNKAIELKSFFGIALTEEEFNLLKEVLE